MGGSVNRPEDIREEDKDVFTLNPHHSGHTHTHVHAHTHTLGFFTCEFCEEFRSFVCANIMGGAKSWI